MAWVLLLLVEVLLDLVGGSLTEVREEFYQSGR